MFLKLTVAVLCLAFSAVRCQSVCGLVGPIWRNDNHTCPPRAICGDKFETVRNWRDERGSCNETRLLSNCLCEGNTVCPFHNEGHALMSSSTHKSYLCSPVCTLPWCQNVHLAPTRVGGRNQGNSRLGSAITRPRFDTNSVDSMVMEIEAPEFAYKNYYKMLCRCPQHTQTAPQRQRALRAFTYRYNWNAHTYSTVYVCNNRWGRNDISDPCV